MSDEYEIDCNLCGKIHVPIWGDRSGSYAASVEVRPEMITMPYTCPVKGVKGEVTFPYSPEIYRKSIVGWKGS